MLGDFFWRNMDKCFFIIDKSINERLKKKFILIKVKLEK